MQAARRTRGGKADDQSTRCKAEETADHRSAPIGGVHATDCEKHLEYWSKNLNITGILLVIWFVVTFVMGYFARDLSFNFFGWPFAFYMGAQGSLIIYV
jgi:putative solute:sodium symporter small subunit